MFKNKQQEKQQECQKCAEYLSLAQRARADYANLKKETEKRRAEFVQFANEALILELVPVFDNFQEAMRHIPDEVKTQDWVIGIEQIKKQMNDFLANQGIETYGKEGEKFDPNLYEALDEIKQEDMEPGKIVKVVRQGYKLHGRVIRPGQAIVAK